MLNPKSVLALFQGSELLKEDEPVKKDKPKCRPGKNKLAQVYSEIQKHGEIGKQALLIELGMNIYRLDLCLHFLVEDGLLTRRSELIKKVGRFSGASKTYFYQVKVMNHG